MVRAHMISISPISDLHCTGIAFSVTDADALALAIARIFVQEYDFARQLITNAPNQPGDLDYSGINFDDIVARRLHPQDIYHRDGFLFQHMMWLAAHLDKSSDDLVSMPHSQGSAKGQDGIIVHRSGQAVSFLTICEDKATDNPRKTIREDVWPEIQKYENNERMDELRSNMIATLCTGGLTPSQAVDLIRGICWTGKRMYRVRVTVDVNGRSHGLFDGFTGIVTGDTRMRRGETVEINNLRLWMTTLSGKVEAELLRMKSEV